LRNSSKLAADEIILRLNGLRNSNHASKISYDFFKAIGKIYERKFQKDLQTGFDVLNPVVQILDSVFVELNNNQKTMKKSIQDSFIKAYAESTYLEFLEKLPKSKLDNSLDILLTFKNPKFSSMAELILDTTHEIKQQEMFKTNSNSYSDVLYSLSAAKSKIEKLLDWTFCSIDKSTFPLIRKYNSQKTNYLDTNISQNGLMSCYDQNDVDLKNNIHKKLKDFSNIDNWKTNQNLSFLIKNNSKTNEALYLDTKLVPDANDLTKVLQVPKYFKNEKITSKKLAKKMNVKPRMALYYLDAAEMLGLVKRKGNSFIPTELTQKLDKYSSQDKMQIVDQMIHELPVVKAFFLYMDAISQTKFTLNDIAKFLEYSTNLSPTTATRRASTIHSWLKKNKTSYNTTNFDNIKDKSVQTYLFE